MKFQPRFLYVLQAAAVAILLLQVGCGGGCPGAGSGGNSSSSGTPSGAITNSACAAPPGNTGNPPPSGGVNPCGGSGQTPSQVLYAVDPSNAGQILPFALDASGNLSLMCDRTAVSGDANIGELAVSQNQYLYLFDATAAKIYAFSIAHGNSGALTPIPGQPFAVPDTFQQYHHIITDPLGRFVYITNYEGNDIDVFVVNSSTGALSVAAGSPFLVNSPFYLATTPSGSYIYAPDSTDGLINILTVSASGQLARALSSPFFIPAAGNFASFDVVHQSLNLLFSANFDSVSSYTLDPSTGTLNYAPGAPYDTFTSQNIQPFMVALDASGNFLYAPDATTGGILAYSVNQSTGSLTLITGSPFAAGSSIFEIFADPQNPVLYVEGSDGSINSYAINASTGALTAPSSPAVNFAAGNIVIANVQ